MRQIVEQATVGIDGGFVQIVVVEGEDGNQFAEVLMAGRLVAKLRYSQPSLPRVEIVGLDGSTLLEGTMYGFTGPYFKAEQKIGGGMVVPAGAMFWVKDESASVSVGVA